MIDAKWLVKQKLLMATRLIVVLLSVATLIFIVTKNAFAGISKDTLKFYTKNNILYYDDCSGGGSSSSGICGDNKNYAGEQVWTDAQMEALTANQPFYEKAASTYGFPWQILAVIHVREHGLARSNPDNGQGIYQFYSAEARANCAGGDFTPGAVSDEQFQIQTNCAAQKIAEGYGSGLDLNTDDGVKQMFFRYNGVADAYIQQALNLGFSQAEAENGEGSPYVMNRYDAKREPSSTWGQIFEDYGPIEYPANNVFGAFVYYKAINCGSDNSSSSSSSSSTESGSSSDNNIINQTALNLAWDTDGHTGLNDAKPEYKTALEQVGFASSGDQEVSSGRSCDVFVATVLRYSGYDPEFYCCMANDVGSYMASHPEKYELVTPTGGGGYQESDLQPGDILSSPRHVALYVKLSDGTGRVASASHGDRMPDTTRTWDLDNGYHAYPAVYRPKNIPSSSSDSSNTCSNTQSSAGGLVSGGMTFEQAQAFMQPYRDAAIAECGTDSEDACKNKSSDTGATIYFDGAKIIDRGTHTPMNNCSAFSEWFSNRYTTAGGPGKDEVGLYQGSATVSSLLSLSKGYIDGGKVPHVYAIFSTGPRKGSADGWWNHTGVVLGIDEANDKIIIGEASDSLAYFPRAQEYSLSEWTNNSSAYGPTYAWTDDIITIGQ